MMPIRVYLSERLRARTGAPDVTANAKNFGDLLDDLDRQFPGFRDDVYSSSKEAIREHITVSLNDVVLNRPNLGIPIADGDSVNFFAVPRGG
jgi:molybdopterin converting factor small subunit